MLLCRHNIHYYSYSGVVGIIPKYHLSDGGIIQETYYCITRPVTTVFATTPRQWRRNKSLKPQRITFRSRAFCIEFSSYFLKYVCVNQNNSLFDQKLLLSKLFLTLRYYCFKYHTHVSTSRALRIEFSSYSLHILL
jgi:hypothetical protein